MTPDYRLRPLGPADADDLHAVASHWAVVRQLGRWPWPPDRAFTESRCRPFEGDGAVWGIQVGGRIVGSVGLVVRDGQMGLGYMLSPALHGKGLMTRVCAEVIAQAWEARPDLERIAATTWHDNPASAAVLRKLGFHPVEDNRAHAVARGVETAARDWMLWRDGREPGPLRYRLTTARLTLRELDPEADAPALARIGGDPRVAPMLVHPTVPWPVDKARAWADRFRYTGEPGFRVAICREGTLIGTGYFGIHDGTATCAYFLDPDHWGQGLATEAMRAFLWDVRERWGVTGMGADHYADNPASGAVLRKLGFRPTGRRVMGTGAARLEPAPCLIYRLDTADLERPS